MDEKIKNAIQKTGLGTADPVTLTPVAGGNAILFTKAAGDVVFAFTSTAAIPPGDYLAEASWAGDILPDGTTDPIHIALSASETVTLDTPGTNIPITMLQTSE